MLCVTITIVYVCFSSTSSSSMRCVAMGSSAEQGSSISSTSGSFASARDAEPLLLAAGQRGPGLAQSVLHLVPQRSLAQRPLHAIRQLPRRHEGVEARSVRDV